jgi:hypothetical protein
MLRPLLDALYAMQQPTIAVREITEGEASIDAVMQFMITTELERIAAALATAQKEVKQPATSEAARQTIERSLWTIATAVAKAQEAAEKPVIDEDAQITIAESMYDISVALGDALAVYTER